MKHQELITQATSQLMVQEWPFKNNKGPGVKKYLNSIGLNEGYSWCMAFVYWCVDEVSKEFKIVNPLKKTGGVLNQWNSRANLRVLHPQPGDIFIMDFGRGLGHTGIVTAVRNGVIETIEGNTNDEASREGYIVARKTRNIKTITGFLRPFK